MWDGGGKKTVIFLENGLFRKTNWEKIIKKITEKTIRKSIIKKITEKFSSPRKNPGHFFPSCVIFFSPAMFFRYTHFFLRTPSQRHFLNFSPLYSI